MATDVQVITLTDHHTLESASEVMQKLQFDRRLPNGRQAYQQLLKNLGFRSNPDGEQQTQSVFQGQCLILGDARVGKTSLKNSLVGKPFGAEEPKTKGVEISLVDRKWRSADAEEGLTFGSFTQFGKSVHHEVAMYGPGGGELMFNHGLSAAANVLFTSLWIIWVFVIIWLLTCSTVCLHGSFYALSLATFSLDILLHFFTRVYPVHQRTFKLIRMVNTLPRFIIGLGTAHVLKGLLEGIECYSLEYSSSKISNASFHTYTQSIGLASVLILSLILFNDVSDHILLLTEKYSCVRKWLEEADSFVPGQSYLKMNNTILPDIFSLMVPVVSGIIYGSVIELSLKTTTLGYCHTLYFMVIPILCFVSFKVVKTLCDCANLQGILCSVLPFYIIMENVTYIFTFKMYVGMYSAWACYVLYKDWKDLLFPLKTQASFTLIFIEKVALNFQKLKSALQSKFASLKMKLLDFSGNKEYYAYHHIFMREHAMYIVVFNMANFADDNFRKLQAKTQRLSFWLESICSKAAPKTPIFLAGTHRGQIDKTWLKSIDEHLRQHLLDTFSDELVINKEDKLLYFPTENSLGRNDRGIQNLQREIMSTAEKHRTAMSRDIPYSWIQIQDAIINLRKNKKAKFCVTLKEFPISVGNFICSNWSKETLKYFHEKGLVIYTDQGQDSELSNWILLKPDILVDIIIQLVSRPTDEEVIAQHGFRRDMKLLHDTGMLTGSLLENILSRSDEDGIAIQSLMEEYDIICPLFYSVKHTEEESQVTHFVPSLLPMSADVNTPVWLDGPDDKVFYVFFHRFLPEPLFQHLLSRAHKNSKVEFPKGQPVICRDVGRFWLRPSLPYRVLQLKNEEMIQVTFSYRSVGNFIIFYL